MIRKLRLWSGLVLWAFVISHLLNHTFLLISIDAANDVREIYRFLWASLPGQVLVGLAFTTHISLALWLLYSRQTLRMHPWEWMQLLLGFAIPFQLIAHVVGTVVLERLYGVVDDYYYILWVYWIASPLDGIKQIIVLVIAWTHGCFGLHFWLRIKPFYRSWAPLLLTFAVAFPLMAMLGVNHGGREILAIGTQEAELRALIAGMNLPDAKVAANIYNWIDGLMIGFAGLIGLALAARLVRRLFQRVRGIVRLTYPAGRVVEALPGMSVLDASRAAGVPHASVCGGRGRCSTCRVRIISGGEHLPIADENETRVLQRVGAPPNVRLACQIRPDKAMQVTPLLPANAPPRLAYQQPSHIHGDEQQIAILFADIRSFTQFSEAKLPYDVVFVLNRYFSAMGQAVAQAGGHLDKFIGDGVMALFGIGKDPERACADALNGARNMSIRLKELNEALKDDLEEPLRIGIGIHFGPAIIGELGYGRATSLTAIGDSVNTASRLESMTKELAVQLVISETVEENLKVSVDGHDTHKVNIRGRRAAMRVRAIADASALPESGVKTKNSKDQPSAGDPAAGQADTAA